MSKFQRIYRLIRQNLVRDDARYLVEKLASMTPADVSALDALRR